MKRSILFPSIASRGMQRDGEAIWETISCRQKKYHYSQFMTCCWCFSTDEMDVGLPQTDIKGTDKASNLQSIIVQETDEYGSGLN